MAVTEKFLDAEERVYRVTSRWINSKECSSKMATLYNLIAISSAALGTCSLKDLESGDVLHHRWSGNACALLRTEVESAA